jgi:hypothetical protein
MTKYSIKPYQEGFDKEQAHIGLEVAKSWLWPLVHDEQDLKQIQDGGIYFDVCVSIQFRR